MPVNSGPITLSTKGKLDTAVLLSNKTLRETQVGLAVTLNPFDPNTTLRQIKGRSPSPLPQAYSCYPIRELQTVQEEELPQPHNHVL